MNVVSGLSLQIHEVIKTIRHVSTVFSITFAVPALTVVVLCANRVSKRYSTLIGIIVILGVACDIVLQLIWDPLMLLPATCILRENPFLRIPGRANQYYETWALTICLNIPVFSACFLERHQAVQSPGSRWLLPMMARHLFIAAILLATIANNFLLRVAQMSSDIQQALLQTLVTRWPTINITSAECYDYVQFIFFCAVCIGGLGLTAAFFALISSHTFVLLRQASTLSETMKKFNSSMTKVLIIQAIVPLILIIFPLIFALIAVIIHVGGPLSYSVCYLFISMHSPAHSVILLTVTPMYRKKFMEIVKIITGTGSTSNTVAAIVIPVSVSD